MYFSEGELRGYANNYSFSEGANRALNKSLSSASTTIFLSHSHKDKELAIGLKNYLGNMGLNLYIDWEDADMPGTPNRETAYALKRRISSTNYFLMLCTDNALQSRWVPWEVGIADMQKPAGKILIAPVTNRYGQFNGNEYLQLYRRIDLNAGRADVFDPEAKYTSTPLRDILSRHL